MSTLTFIKMNHLKLLLAGLFLIACFPGHSQSEDVYALVEQGVELHDAGDYQAAIEQYKKALELEPGSDLVNNEIALSYFAAGEYKKSAAHSRKVLDLKQGDLTLAYINYANALDMQGKTKKAIKAYEEGLKEYDHYLLYFNHSLACFNSGQQEKAEISAINAIQQNTGHASSHLLLSKIMEVKNNRIQAMLPLYFFLLLEPKSERALAEYSTIRNHLGRGVSREGETTINIVVPVSGESDFDAAEMMVSLLKSAENLEENKDKSDLELFADNNDKIFKILGELRKDKTGLWWEFYVPFFQRLSQEKLTVAFSYYISLSRGEEASTWLNENKAELQRLSAWLGDKDS